MIRKLPDGRYRLYSKDGSRILGTYPSRAQAVAREAQVNQMKHVGVSAGAGSERSLQYTFKDAASAEAARDAVLGRFPVQATSNGAYLLVETVDRYASKIHALLKGMGGVVGTGVVDPRKNMRRASLTASVNPVVADAQRRMIERTGMPFPIAEDKQFAVARLFRNGDPYEKQVPISLLTATQRDFDPAKVQAMMADDDVDQKPIDVVKHMNRYVIDDGHHRAMAARFNGDQVILARVVEA